ncbi:MAG: zinc ribbon domain-containing protein [Dechloromonas sp.]|nr:MAG: zinc ribbon domain-containing protein [Dechloromonas sp.]
MNCPNCNAGLSGTPKFCPKCGARIGANSTEPPTTRKCPQCGTENALAAKFCKTDGYRFDSGTPASAVPIAAPRQDPSPVAVAAVVPERPANKKCPQCGSENALAAKFCKTDGYRFDSATPTTAVPAAAPPPEPSPVAVAAVVPERPANKKCPQCGSENALAAKFCKTDGYRFDSATPASAIPAAVPRQDPSPAAGAAVASELTAAAPPQKPSPAPVNITAAKDSDPVTAQTGEKTTAQETPPVSPSPPIANLVICPKCGTANAAGAKFCKKDGVALLVSPTGVAGNEGLASADTERPSVARAEALPSPPVLATEPPPVQVGQVATPLPQSKPIPSSSNALIAAGIAVAVLAAGGGGYWYFAGRNAPTKEVAEAPPTSSAPSAPPASTGVGATRQTVDSAVMMILADAGLSKTIQSTTDADLVVTLYGSVASEEQRTRVLALVKSATGAAAVRDQLEVVQAANAPNEVARARSDLTPPSTPVEPQAPPFDVARVQKDLNWMLRNHGLSGVSIKVNADRSAVLRGKVSTAKEKEDAQVLVSNSPELSSVRNTIQVISEPPQPTAIIDPAKLEGDINRALRNGGVGSVTAQVADDLSVTLKGSVTSGDQKDRAFQIARRFQARGMPKDRIFVIE